MKTTQPPERKLNNRTTWQQPSRPASPPSPITSEGKIPLTAAEQKERDKRRTQTEEAKREVYRAMKARERQQKKKGKSKR